MSNTLGESFMDFGSIQSSITDSLYDLEQITLSLRKIGIILAYLLKTL